MKKILFYLLLSFLTFSSIASSIIVNGNISQNSIWNCDSVKITANAVVDSGVTVTITPGVLVEFQGFYSLNVNGRILAQGTNNAKIIFTVNDTTGFSSLNSTNGAWHGIKFNNTSVENDSSVFDNCLFKYSKALGNTDLDKNGGVFFIRNFSKVRISNCEFKNNIAYHSGGAIYCENSNLNIYGNYFTNNQTLGYDGGAIIIKGISEPIIENNIFYKNYSKGFGGAIHIYTASPIVIKNIIKNNKADFFGGAVCMGDSSEAKFINNLIINNSSLMDGGAFYLSDIINAKFINNTIANNSTGNTSSGGGIYCWNSSPTFINTILYGNHANNGKQVFLNNNNSDPYFFYCDIEGGYQAFGGIGAGNNYDLSRYQNNITSNPNFVLPSSSHGYLVDTSNIDFSLQYPSECINNGTPETSNLFLPQTDLNGNNRIFNDRIDIGAYEYQIVGINNISKNKLNSFNSPNPFNPITTICYELEQDGIVLLEIYNVLGQKINTLVNNFQEKGLQKIVWNGKDYKGNSQPSGLYFYKITVNNNMQSFNKMVLIK